MKQKNRGYQFAQEIKSSALPLNTFLETLREKLSEQEISCTKSKEKTGEANTVGAGMTLGGNIGGGIAKSDLITHLWNPFNVQCDSKTYFFLGRFKGSIKVSEMEEYNKTKGDTSYKLRDYSISGNIKFEPYEISIFLAFCIGVYLSIYFGTGFWDGVIIAIFLTFAFIAIAMVLGNKEIDIPKTKIDNAISNLNEDFTKKF
jgi:hypothetical protein